MLRPPLPMARDTSSGRRNTSAFFSSSSRAIMGLTTAKAVLETQRDILIEKADLEAETVDHVLEILRSEFEEDDSDENGTTETETENHE